MFTGFQGVPPVVLVPKVAAVLMTLDADTEVTERKSCVVATGTLLVGPVMVSRTGVPPCRVPMMVNVAVAKVPLAENIEIRRWVSRFEVFSVATPGAAEDSVPMPVLDAPTRDLLTYCGINDACP